MHHNVLGLIAIAAATAALSPALADAQVRRGHVLSVQGAGGRGFVQTRSVSRQRGAAQVHRSVQTNNGRGYQTSRSHTLAPGSYAATRSAQTNDGRGYTTARAANWSEGSYTGSRTTTTNAGTSFGRATSAVANGDGTANYTSTVTGPKGAVRTVSGTTAPR
ncbi:hypothetical protein ACG3SL_05965 [Sphingomonas sp. CJ20]